MGHRRRSPLAFGLLLSVACVPDGSPLPSPRDAGAPIDAGFADAAEAPDAGFTPDAAAPPDAASADASSIDAANADASSIDAAAPDAAPRPERYSGHTLTSPITPHVAARLRAIAARDPTRAEDVFMKVGASGTVSPHLLYCFAGRPEDTLELAGRGDLLPVIERFRRGRAAGTTPFDRATLAAVSGRSAVWAISGSPSPVEQEIAAVNPRFAFINYGTNDMQLGTTPLSALTPFYLNFSRLVDLTIERGIVPIVTGLNPRTDSPALARWVETYNAVTRGVAEARQVPYINLYLASKDLPSRGLVGDGVHGNVYRTTRAEPCVFTSAALAFNYNVRNLLSVDTLDRAAAALLGGAPEESRASVEGRGLHAEPFLVEELPFTRAADTSSGAESRIDRYPACDRGQDESGPEQVYRFALAAETRLRAVVLDDAAVDVDLHLLAANGDCLARDDRQLAGRFPAGDYRLVVDSFVSGGAAAAGPYLLAILECEPDDPDCG